MVTAVKQTIAPQLFSHTVIFARTPGRFEGPPSAGMKYLVGSGTLIQVDASDRQPRYGVLTCGHVLGAFEKTMEGARNESLTLLVPNNGPGPEGPAWSMTMRYQQEIAIIEGSRNEDSIGPDLAWLPLTRDQAQMLQESGSDARARSPGPVRLDDARQRLVSDPEMQWGGSAKRREGTLDHSGTSPPRTSIGHVSGNC